MRETRGGAAWRRRCVSLRHVGCPRGCYAVPPPFFLVFVLMVADQVYLDHVGTSMYTASQVEACSKVLLQGALGNPHSLHPSSVRSSDLIAETRQLVLQCV